MHSSAEEMRPPEKQAESIQTSRLAIRCGVSQNTPPFFAGSFYPREILNTKLWFLSSLKIALFWSSLKLNKNYFVEVLPANMFWNFTAIKLSIWILRKFFVCSGHIHGLEFWRNQDWARLHRNIHEKQLDRSNTAWTWTFNDFWACVN